MVDQLEQHAQRLLRQTLRAPVAQQSPERGRTVQPSKL